MEDSSTSETTEIHFPDVTSSDTTKEDVTSQIASCIDFFNEELLVSIPKSIEALSKSILSQ